MREAAAAALQGAEIQRSVQLSCGEHTDYGMLTLVNQDSHVSALQVRCNLVFVAVYHTGCKRAVQLWVGRYRATLVVPIKVIYAVDCHFHWHCCCFDSKREGIVVHAAAAKTKALVLAGQEQARAVDQC